MKHTKQLLSIIALIQFSGFAMADDALQTQEFALTHHKGFIGQRAYAAPTSPQAERASQPWEGATLRIEQTDVDKQKGVQLNRLHQLSKRPF